MPMLLCLGLGYCAEHYVAAFGGRFDRVIGTARTPAKAAALAAKGFGGRPIEALAFNGAAAPAGLAAALDEVDTLLVSIPPSAAGDPIVGSLGDALARASQIEAIVYLSTVGVYGDHDGAWVDEATEPRPISARSRTRHAAEIAWQGLAGDARPTVAILRLAGIYGPGQNALVNLVDGTAKRIVKPSQVFNRIHVVDIAQAIEAAFLSGADGLLNVADDEPAPPQDVVAFAAGLLGVAPPPEIPFPEAEKTMTPMARSFYGENKRVRNRKLKAELGVRLRYPTYREGIQALHAAGDHRAARR